MNQPNMRHHEVPQQQRYTYADYVNWQDDRRCELFNGILYEMLPAPSRKHQEVSVNLLFQFKTFFTDKER